MSCTYVIRGKQAFFAEVQIISARRQRGFSSSESYRVCTAAFQTANSSCHCGSREAKCSFSLFTTSGPRPRWNQEGSCLCVFRCYGALQSSHSHGYCFSLFPAQKRGAFPETQKPFYNHKAPRMRITRYLLEVGKMANRASVPSD